MKRQVHIGSDKLLKFKNDRELYRSANKMKLEFYYTLDIDGVGLYLKEVRKKFLKRKKLKFIFQTENFNDASMHEALGFLKDIE